MMAVSCGRVEIMSRKPSPATVRALERVAAGEPPYRAAINEGISPSTIYRALARARNQKTGEDEMIVTIKQKTTGWVVMIGCRPYSDPVPLTVARVIARNARGAIKLGVDLFSTGG